jgi:predicted ATPase with chaperone activity
MFNSVIIDKKLAWDEVFTNLLKHADKKHKEVLVALQAANQKMVYVISTYMSASELAIVPEDETWVAEHLENMQEIIMQSAGYDPEEFEDEEEEEEELEQPDVGVIELPDSEESIEASKVIMEENNSQTS